MTDKQKQLVVESFKKVYQIREKAAELFYKRLFELDPALKKLFRSNLKDQGAKLMATLNVAVNNLDKSDILASILEDMAIRHISYGVENKDYDTVGTALLDTLKTGLGDSFTAETEQAWKELYADISSIMTDAVNKKLQNA